MGVSSHIEMSRTPAVARASRRTCGICLARTTTRCLWTSSFISKSRIRAKCGAVGYVTQQGIFSVLRATDLAGNPAMYAMGLVINETQKVMTKAAITAMATGE